MRSKIYTYWRRIVEWLRWKILKRRRIIGWDHGSDGKSVWTLIEYNERTKIYTVIDEGKL